MDSQTDSAYVILLQNREQQRQQQWGTKIMMIDVRVFDAVVFVGVVFVILRASLSASQGVKLVSFNFKSRNSQYSGNTVGNTKRRCRCSSGVGG